MGDVVRGALKSTMSDELMMRFSRTGRAAPGLLAKDALSDSVQKAMISKCNEMFTKKK